MAKVYGAITEEKIVIPTLKGEVHGVSRVGEILNCYKVGSLQRGDTVKVIAGTKLPIGTEGVVKNVVINKYSPDKNYNPSVFMILNDGREVATVSKNLINLKNVKNFVGGKIFEAEEKDKVLLEMKDYVKNNCKDNFSEMWYLDTNGELKYYGAKHHLEENEKVIEIKETENSYKALIKSDNNKVKSTHYYIVEFEKEFKPNNSISMEVMGLNDWFHLRDVDENELLEEVVKRFTK